MQKLLFLVLFALPPGLMAQGLSDLFEEEETIDYAYATFKTTRVILGQSVENPAANNLLFIVSHHFGSFDLGAYEAFGIDQATMRLGFEYGVTERLAVGIGRSTLGKTADGFIKYKLLRQSIGKRVMPVSVSWFSDVSINGLRWADPERINYFSSRMSYTHSLLVARKFSNAVSLQVMPAVVHRNLVSTTADANDVFVMGFGGRFKLANRISLNAEYHYAAQQQFNDAPNNSLSLGFDIETGGHVFQLHLTNSKAMFPSGFLTATNSKWTEGGIFFGFNITRTFTLRRPEEFR